MKTHDVANFINDSVDWNLLFSMIHAVGDSLNGRKDRFDKAEIIERGLEKYSFGKIRHIDDIGADHFIPDLNVRIEVKFVKNNLFTKVGKRRRAFSGAKLTNTLGSSDLRTLGNTFDYLLLLESNAAALISHEDLIKYVSSNGDGLHAKIPNESLNIIKSPRDICIDENAITMVSYKKEKDVAIDKFLNSFFELENCDE